MNVFSWLWIAWFAGFLAIEIPGAVLYPDRPGAPHTLSATVWWLIRGAGRWHRLARLALLLFLAWLCTHLLTGGWV